MTSTALPMRSDGGSYEATYTAEAAMDRRKWPTAFRRPDTVRLVVSNVPHRSMVGMPCLGREPLQTSTIPANTIVAWDA